MGQQKWMRITVRLPDDVRKLLDEVSEATDRSRAYVARKAIEWYVARELAGMRAGGEIEPPKRPTDGAS